MKSELRIMTDTSPCIDLKSLEFHRDPWGRFLAKWSGQNDPLVVDPVRVFPLTFPREQISLLDADGHEVILIPALDLLSATQRELLERELKVREFCPVIHRILQVSTSVPPCQWEVETDRGRVSFTLDSEDDLRRLPDGTFVIADAQGIRYRVPSVEQLDTPSRAFLRRFH